MKNLEENFNCVKKEGGIYYKNLRHATELIHVLNYDSKSLEYTSFSALTGELAPEEINIKIIKLENQKGSFVIMDHFQPIAFASDIKEAHQKAQDYILNFLKQEAVDPRFSSVYTNILDTTFQGRIHFELTKQLRIPFLDFD